MTAQRFRTHIVSGVLEHVGECGVDTDALVADACLPRDAKHAPWVEIPLSTLHAFLDLASERAGDEALGVSVGKRLTRSTWDLLHVSAASSPTLYDALERIARLVPLFNDVVEVVVARSTETISFVHRIAGEPEGLSQHGNEALLVSFLERMREGTAVDLCPTACWVAHRRGDRAALAAAMGIEHVTSGAGESGFSFSSEMGDLPLRAADPVLLDVLDRLSADALAVLPERRGASSQVCRALDAHGFGQGVPTLAAVARHFSVSVRSLQRRLEEEGSSYRELVDHARRVRARAMLSNGANASDVAGALGYADTATFARAYLRWTGERPFHP